MKIFATAFAVLLVGAFATASFAQEVYSSQQNEHTYSSQQDETQMSSDTSFRPPEHGHPGGGGRPPFHHPPERRPDHNRWGHGGFDHHPGFNTPGWDRREGWTGHYRWEPGHYPFWWGRVAIGSFIILEDIYVGQGVWSCTAVDVDGHAFGAAAPGRFSKEQAVYNAMYDCGGLPVGGAPRYCYVPANYCRYY